MKKSSVIIQGKLLIKPQEDYKNEVKISDIMELVNGMSKTRRISRDLSKIKDKLEFGFEDYDINGYYYYPENDFENFGQTIDKSIINFNKPPAGAPSLWLDFEVVKEDKKYFLVWNGEKENNDIKKQILWINSLISRIFNPVKMSLNGNISIFEEYSNEKVILNIKNNEVSKSDNMIFRPFKEENIILNDFFRNIIKKNQEKDLKKKIKLVNNEPKIINNMDF